MNAQELDLLIKNSAKDNIYVSILGLGLNLNTYFLEKITKNEGCNYFSITKNEEMK